MRQESPVKARQMGDQDGRENAASQPAFDYAAARTQFGARILSFGRGTDVQPETQAGATDLIATAPGTVSQQRAPLSQAEINDGMLRRRAEEIHRSVSSMEPHRSRGISVEQIYQQMSLRLGQ